MTPKEAAEHLSSAFKWTLDTELKEAIQLAIQALEEKQEPEIVPIGTKVRVTREANRHRFKMNEVIEIVTLDFSDVVLPYFCAGKSGHYWLSREEFEIIEQ